MYHKRQFAAWLTAGFSFAAAGSAGRLPWPLAALAALALGGLLFALLHFGGTRGCPARLSSALGLPAGRVLLVLLALWAALMCGYIAALSAAAFPRLEGWPALGLALLGLTYAAAQHGSDACARVGALLMVFLLAFYLLIAGFGLTELRTFTLPPLQHSPWLPLAVLTLPLCASQLPAGKGKTSGWVWLLLAAALAGLLGLTAAAAGNLYEAVMSVSLFGVMERFESLLSAAMAAGSFCLCLLCARGGLCAAKLVSPHKKWLAARLFWFAAVAGLGIGPRLDPRLILTLNLLFWGCLPLLALLVGKRKKDGKRC